MRHGAKPFENLYAAIDGGGEWPVLYSRDGAASVVLAITNPAPLLTTDTVPYEGFHLVFRHLLDLLGEGYCIQKQDIFVRQRYSHPADDAEFLTRSYYRYFEGREYTDIKTYLTITKQPAKSSFVQHDAKGEKDFRDRVRKAQDMLWDRGIKARVLSEAEVRGYLRRWIAFRFEDGQFAMQNIDARADSLSFGSDTEVRCIPLVDVDLVELPDLIQPYATGTVNGYDVATDLMSFLREVPYARCVVYNQVIQIPQQRPLQARLETKAKRHDSLPDASNRIASEDINAVLTHIAANPELLVRCNFNIVIGCEPLTMPKALSFIDTRLYNLGINPSRSAGNQLELFIASSPGCGYLFSSDYDLFLTLAGAAVCLMYKERRPQTEKSPLLISYTDRDGIPVGIDITGKEGENKLTDNANFFCIGPSGSGKSFHMNSVVRQLIEQGTEVVMVDTGNSYEGIAEYFGAAYISYSDDRPISMNPFRVTEQEYAMNFGEKKNFLKSLIFLIYKGDSAPTKLEDTIIDQTLVEYYRAYFHPFESYTPEERSAVASTLALQAIRSGGQAGADVLEEVAAMERERRMLTVKELSFNSYYEYTLSRLPQILRENGVDFNINTFATVLRPFYKGGTLARTLNADMDTDLFGQRFIVFEIDRIKDDPVLFPIVVLIIMDVFLQKMRLKKGRKALIIEEAWKAIASPTMADYIKYLYKTVRKFNGIAGVVTQELNDVIDSPIVREAIINNSDIKILLDQSKFKDRYDSISSILGLTAVQRQQIFTINALNNKSGRSFFREVWICRGQTSSVYGVEEPPECYWAYTTERIEKEALKIYLAEYGDIRTAITRIEEDRKASGLTANYRDFSRKVNALGRVPEHVDRRENN